MKIKKIGIIGLGLIGGSIAKAIKSKDESIDIVAYNYSKPPLILAYDEKIINSYAFEIDSSFSDCQIIFICTPVDTILNMVESLSHFISSNCIVTDVGSTKKKINDEISILNDINFIGGHPMAGSEKSGYIASKHYLFENAYYILCPLESTKNEDVDVLRLFVKELGAIPIIVKPNQHDYAVAAISHIPHVVASALVNMVKHVDEDGLMHSIAAGGFKDITRIASSNPLMWALVSLENKGHILDLIESLEYELNSFKSILQKGEYKELEGFFEEAKSFRDTFISSGTTGSFMQDYVIYVDVEDKPGGIATISTLLSVNNINIKNIGIMNNREFENGVMQVNLPTKESMENASALLKNMNYTVHNI